MSAAAVSYDAPPPAAPTRPRVVLVGSALAAGAAFVGVMALVGMYLQARSGIMHGATPTRWLPGKSEIPLTPSNMAFGTMLLSALTVTWAADAVRRNDRKGAYFALGLTLLFGVAVINATAFIFKVSGIPVASSATPDGVLNDMGVYFYAAVGAHLIMMIVGLLFVATQGIRTLAGERNREALLGASIFWYATVAAHAVIWIAIYIAK
jgi:heme/copper-type cytochrome/quinol oxidase subunit 3